MKRFVLSLIVVALAIPALAADKKNTATAPSQKDAKRHDTFLVLDVE